MATVDIEDDALDSNPATTGSRMIVGYDGTNVVRGESPTYTITPAADGAFTVDVSISEYFLYETDSSCATSSTFCEVRYTDADEYRGNNLDSLTGSSSTVHSIGLLEYTIYEDDMGVFEEESPSYGTTAAPSTKHYRQATNSCLPRFIMIQHPICRFMTGMSLLRSPTWIPTLSSTH